MRTKTEGLCTRALRYLELVDLELVNILSSLGSTVVYKVINYAMAELLGVLVCNIHRRKFRVASWGEDHWRISRTYRELWTFR